MKRQCSLLAGIGILLTLTTHAATTHYVDQNCTNPISPYANWATAATNIQDAIQHSASGDTVLVTNGVYQYGNTANSRIAIYTLTVQSVNGPVFTTIQGYQIPGTTNGSGAVRCAYLYSGATLSGFTLTGGATLAASYGGGVYCTSTNCLVTNCVIINNAADNRGGGAYQGTLVNCILTGNSTAPFSYGNGGGAYQSILVNCLLTRNFAGYEGGGADNCELYNCLLYGNSVATYNSGGGAGVSTLINCTVVSNSAYYGGGTFGGTLLNCIVYNNQEQNPTLGYSNYFGGNFTNCCTYPLPSGAYNFTNPPMFANLAAGDCQLSAASPCVNAGNNAFITNATDLDGNPRIVGGIVDVGAYEFQSPVRYVNVSNTMPVSPFTSWATAATNIQDAVDASTNGDLVLVTNGVYATGGRVIYGSLTNRVAVTKPISVQSVNGPGVTVVQGNRILGTNAVRCVYLTNGVVLAGFTLMNGGTGNNQIEGDPRQINGGGAWCEPDGGAMLSNCVLVANSAFEFGGGAYYGTLAHCTISNNMAGGGGGAHGGNLSDCTVVSNSIGGSPYILDGGGVSLAVLNNCTISGNSAPAGGGADSSTLNNCVLMTNFASGLLFNGSRGGGAIDSTLNNCALIGNSAWAAGGGASESTLNNCTLIGNVVLYYASGPYGVSGAGGGVYQSTLNNCVLSGNSATNGGGACAGMLTNCALVNNQAGSRGGGASSASLFNCTVVGNQAGVWGGGTEDGSLRNCIIYYNSAPQNSNYYSGTLQSCCAPADFVNNGTGNNITNEPLFADLSGGDFHLQSNSPCINSGNNAYVTSATDLDGNPRIIGGTVDIGAYEYQTPASKISYAWLQQYGLPFTTNIDTADLDGTGFNVYQDWIAGLNPINALSVLAMLPPVPTNNPAGLVVSWDSVSNRTYFLQNSGNLGAHPAFSTIKSNILGQSGTTSFTDTNAIGNGPFFYRVGVQQ